MFYDFLFTQRFRGKGVSFLILVMRVFFGVLFFTHGLDKLMNFNSLVVNYPNVLGFGSYMTLMITVFTEFCCSLFLIVGLLQRILTIPMFLSMGVAFFGVHDAMLPEGELALIYLIMFFVLFLTGPGMFSVDYLIDRRIRKEVPDRVRDDVKGVKTDEKGVGEEAKFVKKDTGKKSCCC